MRYLYRCTHNDCRQRIALRYPREHYVRAKKCKACGRELTGQRDREPRQRSKKHRCFCDGYHFPHRMKSLYCRENPKPLTEAQAEARSA